MPAYSDRRYMCNTRNTLWGHPLCGEGLAPVAHHCSPKFTGNMLHVLHMLRGSIVRLVFLRDLFVRLDAFAAAPQAFSIRQNPVPTGFGRLGSILEKANDPRWFHLCHRVTYFDRFQPCFPDGSSIFYPEGPLT